jgi:hypothetical protein
MIVLGIDPGTYQSGWVKLFVGCGSVRVEGCGVAPNDDILDLVAGDDIQRLAIEMIASYGMPVGAEVFRTCVWIGRFVQRYGAITADDVKLIARILVKSHLCLSSKATDANVRQALIDRFGGSSAIGKKQEPGPLYRVKSHAWPALAVALTAYEQFWTAPPGTTP